MCGLVGLIATSNTDATGLSSALNRMCKAIVHRGPDSSGVWMHGLDGMGLGHRRLAIVDLSPAGHQPMVSASERFVMAFNGEIYNHQDLRKSLDSGQEPIAWRGHSDTETLLAGFERWGIKDTLSKAVGMFAIAVWDQLDRKMYLARDRFGEKPLYFGWVRNSEAGKPVFAFASELKAFKAVPGFDNPVDPSTLHDYFKTLYIPAPFSIYQGIFKLLPGALLAISPEALSPSLVPPAENQSRDGLELVRYWNYLDTVEQGLNQPFTDESLALQTLENVLNKAVDEQSLADVPLGAFLSGGVDSSLIVALMQKHSSRKIDTFTIGFDVPGYDESVHAKAVADHLGTRHHELRVSPGDALNLVPSLSTMYCEPFADSSQIPMHLVCQSARSHVTVALSGDAGDEMFGGYNRYFWGPRVWAKTSFLGVLGRNSVSALIQSISPSTWDRVFAVFKGSGRGNSGVVRIGEKLHKLADRLQNTETIDDLYHSLCSEWRKTDSLLPGVVHQSVPGRLPEELQSRLSPEERMMVLDALTYLPGDILCKVDRAAMAISLETRAPFLDHRVAEVAWKLPLNMKVRNGVGKWALRQILYSHVPQQLIERPKSGFALPVAAWLCSDLKEWAHDLLSPSSLGDKGFLSAELVGKYWKEHQNGTHDHSGKLWSVLMWSDWQRNNL